jgi:uncharacterized protein
MTTIEQAKTWYPQNYDPVHGFDHVLRVYHMAEKIALSEGADLEIVRAAALLHDAEGHGAGDRRLDHQHAASEFAGQVLAAEGWPEKRVEAVQHCIRAHRFRDNREQPETIEAKVLFDADKLDAIGAVGVVRAIAYAVLAEQSIFTPPSEQFLACGEKESGEAHTPYHEFLFKLSKLKDRLYTSSGKELAVERHRVLKAFFEQLQRELKAEA